MPPTDSAGFRATFAALAFIVAIPCTAIAQDGLDATAEQELQRTAPSAAAQRAATAEENRVVNNREAEATGASVASAAETPAAAAAKEAQRLRPKGLEASAIEKVRIYTGQAVYD